MRLLPRKGSPAARGVLRLLRAWADLDPTGHRAQHLTRGVEPPLLVTLVYRRRNAGHVHRLLAGLPARAQVVLWALDEADPDLASRTLGTGPGGRLALHERMRASVAGDPDRYWVVSDDDVAFRSGSLEQLVALMAVGGLDVASPAHAPGSEFNVSFALRRPLTLARLTPFVETGPVVAFSPAAQRELLPFPAGTVAGWGMEAWWSSRTHPMLRSAIVDAVSVDHLVPMGTSYDATAEWDACRAFVRRYGLQDVADLKTTSARWSPWAAAPR